MTLLFNILSGFAIPAHKRVEKKFSAGATLKGGGSVGVLTPQSSGNRQNSKSQSANCFLSARHELQINKINLLNRLKINKINLRKYECKKKTVKEERCDNLK
jgi:hypothetical protein